MAPWDPLLAENMRFIFALVVLLVGGIVGYLVGQANRRLLEALDIPAAVEGTSFERTVRNLGTSTTAILARISAWFVYGVTILLALHVAQLLNTDLFWARLTIFLPDLFLGIFILAVGFVVADKAELAIGERIRGVKLPEVGVIPQTVKYSIMFVAALIALGQVGVATGALLIALGIYAVAVITFAGLALRDVLPAAAAGIYLLLSQPYGIGDDVAIGERQGVVQEVNVFVTHIENDEGEYVVPNHLVFRNGLLRKR